MVLPLDGEWQIALDRPNALRLNRWQASTDERHWRDIEAIPLCFREPRGAGWTDQLERSAGETVWYRRHIKADFVPENLEILIENGAIWGDWTLYINGIEVPRARDLCTARI